MSPISTASFNQQTKDLGQNKNNRPFVYFLKRQNHIDGWLDKSLRLDETPTKERNEARFKLDFDPPTPPINRGQNNNRGPEEREKVIIVIYKGGERDVFCPAKKIKDNGEEVVIEFYNRILELKNVSYIEIL
jgi:hypothetical protein